MVVLTAALVVPASAASGTPTVKLALVPVPKSALGAAGRSLPLAQDSGVVSNATAASQASGNVTAKRLKRLGRITGYLLDYGNPFRSAAGATEIQTQIEQYRSVADAQNGLAFWRHDELNNSQLRKFGLDYSLRKQRLAGIPAAHWAYAGTISIKGLEPLHGMDAEFQQGQYLLDVSVSAGSTSAAASVVSKVAHRLYQRMQSARAGRLRGRPVTLPRPLKPGPPAHGPKPASLVLLPADVGSPAKVVQKAYSRPTNAFDPTALSVYDQIMTPAGSFRYLSQQVLVGSSRLEAQYFGAIIVGGLATGFGSKAKVTPVDLSGVGDNAQGDLLKVTVNGQTAYEALVALTHGSYLDFFVAASDSAFGAADARGLAQRAAKRLDSGF